MDGWIVPPPREPAKSRRQLEKEREAKVRWLAARGYLRSTRLKEAMTRVCREDFVPFLYRDYAYQEVPLPLPGERATISCPHSYPLFYEPLGLEEGHRFLEIGLGSGYGTAWRGKSSARRVAWSRSRSIRANLRRAGYSDIVLVLGDGGRGYPREAPYDRICITAACEEVPPTLIEQLKTGGRLICPLKAGKTQHLVLMEKADRGALTRVICKVLYVSLRGRYA